MMMERQRLFPLDGERFVLRRSLDDAVLELLADECYLIGKPLADFPEIVLEVIHTSPLLNKLDVYAGFGVAEVWIFKDGRFRLYELERSTSSYRVIERSGLVPGLDFSMIARYAIRTDTPQALRELAAELRG